jgi:hypothetical protein
MTMYPFFHEPTFWQDVDDVYNGSKDPFQNFAVRMVIAISLQRYHTQYAGLADSFYLAALAFLEDSVKPMNVRTIQCFCLIGSYSLLTPTRTAVYYVIGLAVRLCQALGLSEEKTVLQGANGQRANPLEIDMRRRLFWSTINMEFGLAHSMGRASSFATSLEHIDVNFFEVVDDEYVAKDGIVPNAPRSLRKWICIHFIKMRLLQLEIRRMLYQKKRKEPQNDSHPWFAAMEKKLIEWRDAIPDTDAGTGLDKAWFVYHIRILHKLTQDRFEGRYHTMIVFMFRPSPQCPRPSLSAAQRCFPACKSNIYMHRDQIHNGNVDMTWIFTQAMFMTINTILWTLSYEPIRQAHPREEVEADLMIALNCIEIASERWPGVESALELYKTLIAACLRIYEREGDFDISAGSPVDTSTIGGGSSPSPVPSPSRPDGFNFGRPVMQGGVPPSELNSRVTGATTGSINATNGAPTSMFSAPQQQSSPPAVAATLSPYSSMMSNQSNSARSSMEYNPQSTTGAPNSSHSNNQPLFSQPQQHQQIPLPATYNDLVSWNPAFDFTSSSHQPNIPAMAPYDTAPPVGSDLHLDTAAVGSAFNMEHGQQQQRQGDGFAQWADYYFQPPQPVLPTGQERNAFGFGLTQEDQMELMESLNTSGIGGIQNIVDATNRVFYPSQQQAR